MPRTFWTPARDETLQTNYPLLGPTPTASLLGTSRRSVINRAHRLNLKAPYPKHRASPTFPPRCWSPAERCLAHALLDLFRSPADFELKAESSREVYIDAPPEGPDRQGHPSGTPGLC